MDDSRTDSDSTLHFTRRAVLAGAGALATTGLAGCNELTNERTETESATATPVSSMPDGLGLWLHPESEAVSGSGGVATWRDDSGNGNDLSQSVREYQPAFVEDAVAGGPALRFDGEDDHLLRTDTAGVPNGSARTFVVVAALSDRSARSPFLTQGEFSSNGVDANHYGLEANTFGTSGDRFGAFLVSYAYDADRATDTAYHVHTLRTETFPERSDIRSSTTYYIDGSPTGISVAAGGDTEETEFAGDATALGSFPIESPSEVLHGSVAEVRVYDRALPDDERSFVESALLDQYSIGNE